MKTIIFCLVLMCLPLTAEVTLSSLFTNHMVLQQQSEVAIWGWAKAKSQVEITTSWDKAHYSAKANKKGQWKIMVATPAAGGPYELSISDGTPLVLTDVLIGEVWLCSGQSNMEMPMKGFRGQPVQGANLDVVKSRNNQLRMISVPRASTTVPQDNFEGQWQVAAPQVVSNFSATAYYYGRLLQEVLNVPVGLLDVSYGGSCVEAWMSHATATAFGETPVPEAGDSIVSVNRTPTVLFNGMLNPVIGYGIKGCIWYQGESNQSYPETYATLFASMVSEWRSLWHRGDFPFYYAQIAPFDYSVFAPNEYNEKYNSAYLREAQLKAKDMIPNSGMISLMDIGEKTNIHPVNKKVGGERFALLSLADAYGIEGFGYQSPAYNGMSVDGSTVIVSFKDMYNGLTSYGKEVTCFEIAGENKRFYPATAVVRSKSVKLSSPHVSHPVAVRYAFKDFVVGNLFAVDGNPVASFRTDEW